MYQEVSDKIGFTLPLCRLRTSGISILTWEEILDYAESGLEGYIYVHVHYILFISIEFQISYACKLKFLLIQTNKVKKEHYLIRQYNLKFSIKHYFFLKRAPSEQAVIAYACHKHTLLL